MTAPDQPLVAELKLASTVGETRRLHAWLDEILPAAGLSDRTCQHVRLCLEEAFMNIAMHGYGEDDPGPVELVLWRAPPGLLARMVDRAPPFDPTTAALPPPSQSLADGPLGCRGLQLIRRFATELRYERAEGQNRLTLGFAA